MCEHCRFCVGEKLTLVVGGHASRVDGCLPESGSALAGTEAHREPSEVSVLADIAFVDVDFVERGVWEKRVSVIKSLALDSRSQVMSLMLLRDCHFHREMRGNKMKVYGSESTAAASSLIDLELERVRKVR